MALLLGFPGLQQVTPGAQLLPPPAQHEEQLAAKARLANPRKRTPPIAVATLLSAFRRGIGVARMRARSSINELISVAVSGYRYSRSSILQVDSG